MPAEVRRGLAFSLSARGIVFRADLRPAPATASAKALNRSRCSRRIARNVDARSNAVNVLGIWDRRPIRDQRVISLGASKAEAFVFLPLYRYGCHWLIRSAGEGKPPPA